jgi:hypothetical protein
MGVNKTPVKPSLGFRGESFRGEFSSAKHYLPVATINDVAVNINVNEVII